MYHLDVAEEIDRDRGRESWRVRGGERERVREPLSDVIRLYDDFINELKQ